MAATLNLAEMKGKNTFRFTFRIPFFRLCAFVLLLDLPVSPDRLSNSLARSFVRTSVRPCVSFQCHFF